MTIEFIDILFIDILFVGILVVLVLCWYKLIQAKNFVDSLTDQAIKMNDWTKGTQFIECVKCGWVGIFNDLTNNHNNCPKCNAYRSWREL